MNKHLLTREFDLAENRFVNREAALHQMRELLSSQSPQNCNVVGEPRIGKSALLYQVYVRKTGLSNSDCLVLLQMTKMQVRDSRAFWCYMLTGLQAVVQGKGSVSPLQIKIEGTAGEAFDELIDLLNHMLAQAEPPRIIFLIDDFHLMVPRISVSDLDWFRSLLSTYDKHLAVIISSTDPLYDLLIQEPALARNEVDVISPLLNLFTSFQVGLLDESSITKMAKTAAIAKQQSLTEQDVSFLRHEVGRHPDLLKIGSHYLFRAKEDSNNQKVGESYFENVQSDIRSDVSVRALCDTLIKRWRNKLEEWEVLAALAQKQSDTRVGDRVAWRELERRGLIEFRDGKPSLFADTFKFHLKRSLSSISNQLVDIEQPKIAPLLYFPERREVRVDDQQIRLTPLENRLLEYLVNRVGEVCSVEELLQEVWGPGRSEGVVEKAINRLRTKVEPDPKRPIYIISIWGEGYSLQNGDFCLMGVFSRPGQTGG